eukprot:GFUD01038019.1.p1 GENE.GFUD01038019.1~~GFUD01038019.1.p1  ORF type:complete len:181 (-),score=33.30 GFUD01038019.1:17-559(-)
MVSLRSISSLAIIKYGIARDELPLDLIEELRIMEGLIKSDLTLTGEFFPVNFVWDNGEWRFSIPNQQPVTIRAGGRNFLGLAGGKLFLFDNRKISIDDFKIDLKERRITFYGMCSSVKNSDGRVFKSTISFPKFHDIDAMKMSSEVVGDHGKSKVRERIFSTANSEMCFSLGLDCESHSE